MAWFVPPAATAAAALSLILGIGCLAAADAFGEPIRGPEALGPRPRTTRPAPGHKIYPYLLRDVTIERPN